MVPQYLLRAPRSLVFPCIALCSIIFLVISTVSNLIPTHTSELVTYSEHCTTPDCGAASIVLDDSDPFADRVSAPQSVFSAHTHEESPAALTRTDGTLRVFTLNCWGLKWVSKHRNERVAAIASLLANSDYDIVALQELWVTSDYAKIRAAVSASFPHARYFHSGALGSGLAIFSRFPVVGTTIHPYSLNGSPMDVMSGDWYVGKAAASILVDHPEVGYLQIFNTHLYSRASERVPLHFRAHHLVNAYEFSKLIRHAAAMGRTVIAVGDLNTVPESFPVRFILEHTGARDAWNVTHSIDAQEDTAITPELAVQRFGITADSPLNTYTDPHPKSRYVQEHLGKRLDYMFYRGPARGSRHSDVVDSNLTLDCVTTNVILTEPVPGTTYSYSDHFGLETTFQISSASVARGVDQTPPDGLPWLSEDSIDTFADALKAAYKHAKGTNRFYLMVFSCCLGSLLFITIASAWVPRSWANPAVVATVIGLSWLATTMLYVGFIYGNWEMNALRNVREELELIRAGFEG
ncbi:DNase I-like protein [Punctularia strigosozonata HHB-11173 SS5]|uniref:DNase I-like protein n=1 Tax=Punctularia strigosozonata (strain HHB-11173) TaxID=741275 RepID=UPI0004416975|nr:DNase I-like protein [Punctularia strigosozonata HHB-11173 SS5]EIN13859.1 DNase I-like protein [Punctularia strigosozonata HHB-11173 SS5]